jgi:protein-tyrosine phosphatase
MFPAHARAPISHLLVPLATGGVLVHCAAGISRSASFVIAYLMYSEKLAFKEAAAAVKEVRPVICPNPGFVLQLKEWEKLEHEFSMWQVRGMGGGA